VEPDYLPDSEVLAFSRVYRAVHGVVALPQSHASLARTELAKTDPGTDVCGLLW
jgi:hypothetical protein